MRRTPVVALALGALLLGTPVRADNNVSDHGTHFENAQGQRTDALGNQYVIAGDPLEGKSSGYIVLINDTTSVGSADSSQVQSQYANYVIHGLLFIVKPAYGVASPAFVRLCFSIRTHFITGGADSSGLSPVFLQRAAATTAGIASDSLSYGNYGVLSSNVQAADYEVPVTIYRAGGNWGDNANRYVPIETPSGQGLRLPNFSVRERVLTGGMGAGTIAPAISVYAYCTVAR